VLCKQSQRAQREAKSEDFEVKKAKMNSFLMGSIDSIKNAWHHYNHDNGTSLNKNNESKKKESSGPVTHQAGLLSLNDVVFGQGEPEGQPRLPSKDHGYDSITSTPSLTIDEALSPLDATMKEVEEEVFDLELGESAIKTVLDNKNVQEASISTPDNSAISTVDNSSYSSAASPHIDWNAVVGELGSSPQDANKGDHAFPVALGNPTAILNAAALQQTVNKMPYKPEDPSVYAQEYIFWKLELEKSQFKTRSSVHPSAIKDASIPQCADIFALPTVDPPLDVGFHTGVTYNHRQVMVQWLGAVNRQMKFSLETYCLGINMMDRFLAVLPIDKNLLQLAGLTAWFIAAKIEEIEPPKIPELINICHRSYENKHFRWMEHLILTQLEFHLSVPTAAFFLSHLVELGGGEGKREDGQQGWPWELARHLMEMAMYLQKRCAFTGEIDAIPPSQLAEKIYNFVNRQRMMTCLMDEGQVSPADLAKDLYKIFHIELTKSDELLDQSQSIQR